MIRDDLKGPVDWGVKWAAPQELVSAGFFGADYDDARMRLHEVADAALFHALTSGDAVVTLHVRKSALLVASNSAANAAVAPGDYKIIKIR